MIKTDRFLKGYDASRDLAERVADTLRTRYGFDRVEIESDGDGFCVAVTHGRDVGRMKQVADDILTFVAGYYVGNNQVIIDNVSKADIFEPQDAVVKNALTEYPALVKLRNFIGILSAAEQMQIFEAFDSHEFLAYDMLGEMARNSNPDKFQTPEPRKGVKQ